MNPNRLHRRYCIACAIVAGITALAAVPGIARAATGSSAAALTIVVLGDSLSAEYGLQRGRGWVALLQHKFDGERIKAKVVNASISGDTSAGGRARLSALLAQQRPTHVIIELGGNDALRGLPLALTRDNLTFMVKAAQQAGARVLLLGMQIPPNYGRDYSNSFAALFASVAKAQRVALVPFLLRGIADRMDAATLFQADGLHPNEQAQSLMLANVWPELKKIMP